MPKTIICLAILCLLGVVMAGRVGAADTEKLDLGIEVLGAQFYAAPFSKHGPISKIRLGAAYLLRPELAQSADVVWGYTLSNAKIQTALSETLLEAPLYFKAANVDSYTILSGPASMLAIKKAGSIQALFTQAKGKGIEVGVVLDQPTWSGVEHDRAMINWDGGTDKLFFFRDETMAQHAIFELMQSGDLKKIWDE